MSSFKYKNMQQFVKQTLYPYVVNLTLLIKDLFNRVANLENSLGTDIDDQFKALQDQITSNDTDIASLQNQILSNDSDISNLQDQIASNDSVIDDIQTNIAQIYGVDYNNITASTMLLTPNELTAKVASIYGVTSAKLESANLPSYKIGSTTKTATPGNISTDLVAHVNSVAKSTTAATVNGTNPHHVTYMSLEDWTYGTLPPDEVTLKSNIKVYDQILSSV